MDEPEYKKKYFMVLREVKKIESAMEKRCPIVKSCCGGCNLINKRIKKIKKDTEWTYKED